MTYGIYQFLFLKYLGSALAAVAQVAGVSPSNLKGCGFDSQSGHRPRLCFDPCRGTQERQLVHVSLSHGCFSPSLSLPPPLSKINNKNVSWELQLLGVAWGCPWPLKDSSGGPSLQCCPRFSSPAAPV